MTQKSSNIVRRSTIPPDDGPCQMAPFSDDRWEMDRQENLKRRETHRNLVYANLKPFRNPSSPRVQETLLKPEEPKPPAEPTPMHKDGPKIDKKFEPCPEIKFDFVEKDPVKPKSLTDLTFESPGPLNLFPLLKFPERRPNQEDLHKSTNCYIKPVTGKFDSDKQEPSKRPQFLEFKDIKNDRVVHYGATVPFWEFK